MMRALAFVMLALGLAACASAPAPVRADPPASAQTIKLSGVLTGADHATYVNVPFTLPPGARTLSITVDHDGRDKRTTIDLGLRDPAGFRGWSGSNKTTIRLADFEATPSFRPGPLLPGKWTLILGVPHIAEDVTTRWTASIAVNAPAPPPSPEPHAWVRGDFHTHTGHSDGSCPDANGVRHPCPVHETLDAARRAGLDFVAVTDHNTFAQNNSLAELEAFYPGLAIIRGAEITTFQGHANAFGVRYPLDFQLGTPRLPTVDALLDQVDAQGGVLSLNHPGLVSGRACMGCGWTAHTDYDRVAAVEVVNGSAVRTKTHEGPTSGIGFWEKLLDAGHRLTAIGGSDNHDPTDDAGRSQPPLGKPTTVIWSAGRSERAILDGLKSGRVFIDLGNQKTRTLDMTAEAGDASVAMGGVLRLAPGASGALTVSLSGAEGGRIEIVSGGLEVMQPAAIVPGRPDAYFELEDDARFGWIRVNVRAADDTLMLLGNPIYVRAPG
jgi:hypothetical protein